MEKLCSYVFGTQRSELSQVFLLMPGISPSKEREGRDRCGNRLGLCTSCCACAQSRAEKGAAAFRCQLQEQHHSMQQRGSRGQIAANSRVTGPPHLVLLIVGVPVVLVFMVGCNFRNLHCSLDMTERRIRQPAAGTNAQKC